MGAHPDSFLAKKNGCIAHAVKVAHAHNCAVSSIGTSIVPESGSVGSSTLTPVFYVCLEEVDHVISLS